MSVLNRNAGVCIWKLTLKIEKMVLYTIYQRNELRSKDLYQACSGEFYFSFIKNGESLDPQTASITKRGGNTRYRFLLPRKGLISL